jgi:hypothetical protein
VVFKDRLGKGSLSYLARPAYKDHLFLEIFQYVWIDVPRCFVVWEKIGSMAHAFSPTSPDFFEKFFFRAGNV